MDIFVYLQLELFLVCFSIAILLYWAGVWLLHVLSICYGKWRLYRKADRDPEVPLPGVSVLKPLVGIDSNLFSNLETFFTLDYPVYELLFCVHSEQDPALMLVKSLMKKYPKVDARIFTDGPNVGLNPKINNMNPGYKAAKYDLILISDAGMRMKPDTVQNMVESMTEKIGMVTQLPFTSDRKGFGGTLEKVYFGTAHARIYIGADLFGVICSTGMSSMFRKNVMDDLGGIEAFGKYIAEDYFFASRIVSRGWKCAVSTQPAQQNAGGTEVQRFHERICRWTKLRIAMLPSTILLEPLQECMLLGFLASFAANLVLEWNSLIFFLIHVLSWMLLDYVMLLTVQNGPLPFGKFEYVISWLYRELSAFPVFLWAMLRPSITWRMGGTLRLKWGGEAELIPPPSLIKEPSAEAGSSEKKARDSGDPEKGGNPGSSSYHRRQLSETLIPSLSAHKPTIGETLLKKMPSLPPACQPPSTLLLPVVGKDVIV